MKFYAPQLPYAVTFYCDKIPPQLISEVQVFSQGNKPKIVNALWDTGASNSCVSKKLIDELHLQTLDSHVMYTAGGSQFTSIHNIGIRIAEKFSVGDVVVNGIELGHDSFDVIIGMDIIGQGDLSVGSTNEGKYMISFRYPTMGGEDYVKLIRAKNLVGQSHKKKR